MPPVDLTDGSNQQVVQIKGWHLTVGPNQQETFNRWSKSIGDIQRWSNQQLSFNKWLNQWVAFNRWFENFKNIMYETLH